MTIKTSYKIKIILALFNIIFVSNSIPVLAQKVLVEGGDDAATGISSKGTNFQPEVGRQAAQKYFSKSRVPSSYAGSPSHRLLGLHWGGFLNSKAFDWGQKSVTERTGDQTVGVTYKIGEWVQAMDLNIRFEYTQYAFQEKNPIKLSLLPLFTFPESSADFPLYFGGGVGAGVFMSQMDKESTLSLDYQLVFGLRLQNIWGRSGFFIESGIKDHLHLLSDGQFTGQFLGAGAVFSL